MTEPAGPQVRPTVSNEGINGENENNHQPGDPVVNNRPRNINNNGNQQQPVS